MSHPNKVKGTRFESDVVGYLAEPGYFETAERRALAGTADKGDIVNVPRFALECKNEARINLSGYMTEAEAEAKNAGTEFYAAIVKRRGKGVAQAFAVMPLERLREIIRLVQSAA